MRENRPMDALRIPRKVPMQALLLLAALSSPALAQDRPDAYIIGPRDVLHVAVLGQPEMTGDFRLDADGVLQFPFLGAIPVGGRSLAELERQMVALLSDGYLKNPRVAVSVKEFHSLRVFVTGEVFRPGAYGLRSDRSLLELTADIGELTPNAGHQVIVIRPPQPAAAAGEVSTPPPDTGVATAPIATLPGEVTGAQVFRLSLREVRSGDPQRDFRLVPGDTVFFPKAAQFYVTGHVAHAGAFRFEEGLTVHSAINLAGGATDRASAKVKVVRIVDGRRREIPAKPTDLLQPEDTIVVPERLF